MSGTVESGIWTAYDTLAKALAENGTFGIAELERAFRTKQLCIRGKMTDIPSLVDNTIVPVQQAAYNLVDSSGMTATRSKRSCWWAGRCR